MVCDFWWRTNAVHENYTRRLTMAANAISSYNNMAKNMADELEKRQKDWQKDVEQMQQDFFKVNYT